MQTHNATTLPVLYKLASEYLSFDDLYASVPGCTNPNRNYLHSATSSGSTDNAVPADGWSQRTIYELLDEKFGEHDTPLPWAMLRECFRTFRTSYSLLLHAPVVLR